MATNQKYASIYELSVPVTDPATPASGDPVRFGSFTGVALCDEGDGGNASDHTSVDFGPKAWTLSVKGVDDGGNSAVVAGDELFYVDGDTPKISKKASGYFYGYAMEGVNSGATKSITVAHVPSPGAGSLAVGSVGSNEIASSAVGEAEIADGAVTRAKLAENVLQPFEIPFGDVLGADGADLAVSETAGDFFRNIGTNQLVIDGEATINETEVSVGWFRFTLPDKYVAAGDVKVRVVAGLVDAGTADIGACTIDVEAREQGDNGTVGADLVTTAAQAISTTFAAKDFVVTAAGLVAGDVLVCKLISSVVETAGGSGDALNSRITKLQMLCDVK